MRIKRDLVSRAIVNDYGLIACGLCTLPLVLFTRDSSLELIVGHSLVDDKASL